MENEKTIRIDEVSKYYNKCELFQTINKVIFLIIVIFSFTIPFISQYKLVLQIIKTIYLLITISYFVISQILRFYLVPFAENRRRKQLLSNSFGVPLSIEKTELYYNNSYSPSIMRLAAIVMENSLFSKTISAKMLIKTRVTISIYMIVWISLFSIRQTNIDILTWITQIVFSSEVAIQWLSLEYIRYKFSMIYESFYSYFLKNKSFSNMDIALILDLFAEYESAKSVTGQILSTKIFDRINDYTSEEWEKIKLHLAIGENDEKENNK